MEQNQTIAMMGGSNNHDGMPRWEGFNKTPKHSFIQNHHEKHVGSCYC